MRSIYQFFLLGLVIMTHASVVFAGQQLEEKIRQFNQYHADNYQELIYIHTDKNYYLAGEQVRFKVYCMDKSTSRLSPLSKVAYVEFLDMNNVPRIQTKIELINGAGHGAVFIPTGINSGNFILRGYTRWMRNYGPESFFHSAFVIINPFKRLGLSPMASENDVSINFFPEGKVLIQGHKSKIVYDCRDGNGKPCSVTGKLLSNDTLVVEEFTPGDLGIGSFEFKPVAGQKYHVELQHADGSTTKHAFAPIENEGLAFQLKRLNSTFSIDIFCNDPTIAGKSDELYYVIHRNGKIVGGENIRLVEGIGNRQLTDSIFDTGISQITLFSEEGRFLAQRHLFMAPDEHVEMIDISKNTLANREKATIDLEKPIFSQDNDVADISISVSTYRPEIGLPQLGLDNYLLIGNALNAHIYQAGKILDGPTEQVSSAINNLLIAYAGVDTSWQSNKSTDHVFIPEYRAPLITGKMIHKETNEPVSGVAAYISVVGKQLKLNSTRSKRDGTLIFEMRNLYGSNEIVLQTDYTKDTLYSIVIDDPFSTEFANIEVPLFDLSEELASWIKNESQYMQVRNAYKKYQPDISFLNQVDSTAFYGTPDSRYYLDDFTRFIVMEEVMREYISGVNVRKNKDGFHFMVLDIDRNEIFQQNPLMLLDGVPIFDANEIIALDPLKIQKIETIKRRFHKGYLDCRGIVSYTSYNGDLDGYSLHDNAMIIQYEGIQKIRPYLTPTYATEYEKRSTMPDFRDVLLWDPHHKTTSTDDSSIEFYTSDIANTYQVSVNLLTNDGRAFSARKNFQVQSVIEK